MIDKTKFLAGDDDPRYYLSKPFNTHGKTVYSNGYVMICEPIQPNINNLPPSTLKLEKILQDIEAAEYQKPSWPQLPEKLSCPECDGTGIAQTKVCPECDGEGDVFFSTNFNDYAATCQTCHGDGKSRIEQNTGETCSRCHGTAQAYQLTDAITVHGISIYPAYAELIMHDPDIEVSADVSANKLMFRSGPLCGAIAGMRILTL